MHKDAAQRPLYRVLQYQVDDGLDRHQADN